MPDGLRKTYGIAWAPLLVGAAAGLVLLARRSRSAEARPAERRAALALILFAVATTAAYIATPTSAYGPEGDPWQFALNLRYGAFAVLAGLLALVIASPARARPWLSSAFVLVTLCNLADSTYTTSALRQTTGVVRSRGLRRRRPSPVAAWARRKAPVAVSTRRRRCRFRGRHRDDRRRRVGEPQLPRQPVRGRAHRRVGAQLARRADRHRRRCRSLRALRPRLSNEVVYLGEQQPGRGFGSANDVPSAPPCPRRRACRLVVAGEDTWGLEPALARSWLASDPVIRPVDDPVLQGLSPSIGVYTVPRDYVATDC